MAIRQRKVEPLFATESTSAALLDMKPAEFRTLVAEGALPPPVRFDRWCVDTLQTIMNGTAARPQEGFEL
jgi:hypothetical protein